MKTLFLLFFGVIFLSLNLNASPAWFYKLTDKEDNRYIGYGVASSAADAKREALLDIASQIEVSIDSSLSMEVRVKNGKVNRSSSSSDTQKIVATLSDYKLLKSEYAGGEYFVALSYENIPSLDKFVKKVQKILAHKKSLHLSNPYLDKSAIAKELEQKLGTQIAFSLQRKDKKWFIKYKSVMQVLDARDFSKFFVSVANENLTIQTSKHREYLYDEERFYFEVSSKKEGYVSILSVYEDGTVSSLVRNIKVGKNRLENIPDAAFETIPQAGLLHAGEETYDLYVLLFSTKKLHLEMFAYADADIINEEKYKNFDLLIKELQTAAFTTLKIVTKPKR